MKLKAVLIADPVPEVAHFIAEQCDRLAERTVLSSQSSEILAAVEVHHPEMVILSLELGGNDAARLTQQLRKQYPELFIVGTYRELAVPAMEKLGRLGMEDFIAQPMDAAELYRAASRRFRRPFRRHDRYSVTLDVFRADGVLIGRTHDLSEGGMAMDAIHPVPAEGSLLVDIPLPDSHDPMRVRALIIRIDGEPPKHVRASLRFDRLRSREQQRLAVYLKTLGEGEPKG